MTTTSDPKRVRRARPGIDPADLADIRERQERLRSAMRSSGVTHPSDLPVQTLIALRGDRLGGT